MIPDLVEMRERAAAALRRSRMTAADTAAGAWYLDGVATAAVLGAPMFEGISDGMTRKSCTQWFPYRYRNSDYS